MSSAPPLPGAESALSAAYSGATSYAIDGTGRADFIHGTKAVWSLTNRPDLPLSVEDEVVWRFVAEDRSVGRTAIFGIDRVNRRAETSKVIGHPSPWEKGSTPGPFACGAVLRKQGRAS